MIGNIIAYTMVGLFAIFGVAGTINAVFFDKEPDRIDGFWGSMIFLGLSWFCAWVWGI